MIFFYFKIGKNNVFMLLPSSSMTNSKGLYIYLISLYVFLVNILRFNDPKKTGAQSGYAERGRVADQNPPFENISLPDRHEPRLHSPVSCPCPDVSAGKGAKT